MSESSWINTQGSSDKTINALVPEADPCIIILAEWDAWAVCSEKKHS